MLACGRPRSRPLAPWLVPVPTLGDRAGPPAFYRGGTGSESFGHLPAVTRWDLNRGFCPVSSVLSATPPHLTLICLGS